MLVAPLIVAPFATVAPPFNVVAPVTPSEPPTVVAPVTPSVVPTVAAPVIVADANVEAPADNVPLTVVAPNVDVPDV